MMIRIAVIAALSLGAAACSTVSQNATQGAQGRSYQLDPGTADYDSLQRATALCKSRGGTLVPRKDANLEELSDYSCVIPKSK
jgi:putative hemolysin